MKRTNCSREKSNPTKGVTVLVEVKKKDGESFESLLRRFNRKIQQSGVLVRARKTRFYEPTKSKLIIREDARRRAASRVRREELKKSGKLPVRRGFSKKF